MGGHIISVVAQWLRCHALVRFMGGSGVGCIVIVVVAVVWGVGCTCVICVVIVRKRCLIVRAGASLGACWDRAATTRMQLWAM